MLKNLSVYISAYLDNEEDYYKLLTLIPDFIKVNIINDNPNFQIKGIKNNDHNIGKFQTIINEVKNDNKKFMISIDPDDILLNNIDWKKLLIVDKTVTKFQKVDLIVNSYFIKKGGTSNFKFIKRPKYIFNPCTIYNLENLNINSCLLPKDFYINYMEDLCLALISLHGSWNIKYINTPFYKYVFHSGISTLSKSNFSLDLENSSIINDIFSLKIKSLSLLNFKIMRVNRMKRLYKKYGK